MICNSIKMERSHSIILTVFLILFTCVNLVVIREAFCAASDTIQSNKGGTFGSIRLPQILDFTQFKQRFHRHYASYTEELRRQKLFVARYVRAFVSRVKYHLRLITTHLGINNLSDRTRQERERLSMKSNHIKGQLDFDPVEVKKLLTSKRRAGLGNVLSKFTNFLTETSEKQPKPSDIKVVYGYDIEDKAEVPIVVNPTKFPDFKFDIDRTKEGSHYNLIESGCFNPPGHQGECGSCYAFTGMAIAEYLFCRSSGKSIKFSEQFVLDCGKPFDLDGCEGGTFEKISEFIDVLGFEVDQWYPYKESEGVCRFLKDKNSTKITNAKSAGYIRMKSKPKRLVGAEEDWEVFLQLGIPLDVTIAVDIDVFEDYGGGVDLGHGVGGDDLHSMTLVGSGIERGVEYWLLRNSFGLDWGEQGHYKLKKKSAAIEEEGLGETFEAFLDDDLTGLFEFNPNYKRFQ